MREMFVDETELRNVITALEASNTYSCLDELHKAIAATDWAKNHQPKPITFSTALLRIKKYGIETKTTKGKRGYTKGHAVSPEERKKRVEARKSRKLVVDAEVVSELRKNAPTTRYKLIEKVVNGSMSAAIRLKCLDCTCYNVDEIRDCSIKGCALWNFRPYATN